MTALQIRRYAYIDALRGWAILLVLLVHAGEGNFAIHMLYRHNPSENSDINLPIWLRIICDAGGDGVVLFFVVSALSITLSAKARNKIDIYDYAVRRFLRIAPMYYCGIAFYLFLFGWGPRYTSATGITSIDVIANFTFTHGFRDSAISSVVPGGWSIAAEVIYYVLIPFILYILEKAPILCIAFCATSVFVSLTYLPNPFHFYQLGPVSPFYFTTYIPGLAFGVVAGLKLAESVQEKSSNFIFFLPKPKSKYQLTALSLLSIIIIIMPMYVYLTTFIPIHNVSLPIRSVITAIIGALLCIRLSGEPNNNRIVVNVLLCRLGMVSFSMYIVQFALFLPAFRLSESIIHDHGALFFVVYYVMLTCMTFIVANVTYELIERPFIRLSSQLATHAVASASSVAADQRSLQARGVERNGRE